ncbi:MAG: 16S rRNA processing protein RimM [Citromicrobium sp.]|nr:16S rRNA processing protein RimM [Citromicrobium sp.]
MTVQQFGRFHLAQGALGIRALGDGFEIRGLDLVAILRFDRLAALVVLVGPAEIADRTAAEALRGTVLTVPRDALPPLEEGEFYHADLIGLPVVTDDGEAIGTTSNIMNYGATDIVEIAPETGAPFMVPLIPDAVPDWDSERLVLARAFLP